MTPSSTASNSDTPSHHAMARHALSIRLEDEFDAHANVYKARRLWMRIAFVEAAVVLLLIAVNISIILRQPYVLQRPLRLGDKPILLKAGRDAPITTRDLEDFFLYALRLRYGWDAMTVFSDWDELSELSVKEYQAFLNAFAAKPIEDPEVPNTTTPRYLVFMKSRLANEVALARDAMQCGAAEPVNDVVQYYCRGFGAIVSTPFDKDGNALPPIRKEVEFSGRFQPAYITLTEPQIWGLSVAHLDSELREEATP